MSSAPKPRDAGREVGIDATAEAVLGVSRILVGIALRSVKPAAITLPQYRALVVLSELGEQKVGELADRLAIHPSTATRLCDRLHASGYIERATSPESRREVTIGLSAKGRTLVRKVISLRRDDFKTIVAALAPPERAALVAALAAFAAAAVETSDDAWKLGWSI